jgi:acetylornithine deacetylase
MSNSISKLLRELIALPSVNPAFLPVNDPRAGEHRVADFVASLAAQSGLAIEFHEVFPGRKNLLAHLVPTGKVRQQVVLAPHFDTVGAATMPDTMFQPELRHGRIYGRGACDTKGSVAAMLGALMGVARSGRRPAETLVTFAGLVDEENGQGGSRALAQTGFKADLAVVGEPTRLQVVTAHKGDLWLRLRTQGKAAHGSRPELGRNAVHLMARVVDLLETDYAQQLRGTSHPLLGSGTVNVGSIVGGTQPNIVPDRCEISIDRRTLPGETEGSVRREMMGLLRQRGLKAELINTKDGACVPLETDPDLQLVRELRRAAGSREPRGVDFFCDAAILAAGGTPSVVFGPGDIAQAHTADEWISVKSLERGAEILTRFLRALP